MPRTVWTKLSSDPNGTWSRYEGEPPFSVPATARLSYDIYSDTGESFIVTPLDAVSPPALSGAPAVAGTYEVSQTLTGTAAASTGTAPITTLWQWLRDGADIPGATAASYLLTSADEGTQVSVRQTNTNAHGSDSAVSAAQTVQPAATGAAQISGLVVSDQATNGELALTYSISADSALTGVLTTSASAPTAAQVLAGQNHTGASASDSFTDTWTTSGSDTLQNIAAGLASGTYYLHVLPSGGGDGDVASSSGFTLETILPTVSSAATNTAGDTITLSMSENVSGTGDGADWTITGVSAGAPTIDNVVITGSSITLAISGNIVASGDTVTVDYSPGDIMDAVANPLVAFTGQAVTNNVASYGEVLVDNNGSGWVEAPAAAGGTHRTMLYFFSGSIRDRITTVASFSSTNNGMSPGFTNIADYGGLYWRFYSDTSQNMIHEAQGVPVGERYSVIATWELTGTLSVSKIRLWRQSTGWQVVQTKSEADTGAALPNVANEAVNLFRRADEAGKLFDGTCARNALWTANQAAPIIDVNNTAELDRFIDATTGVTLDPSQTNNTNGYPQPLFDFHGPASNYATGTHTGSLGTFTSGGVFS